MAYSKQKRPERGVFIEDMAERESTPGQVKAWKAMDGLDPLRLVSWFRVA